MCVYTCMYVCMCVFVCVCKQDVMRASIMLERKKREFAVILCFDVKVTPEAQAMADDAGVTIFTADSLHIRPYKCTVAHSKDFRVHRHWPHSSSLPC